MAGGDYNTQLQVHRPNDFSLLPELSPTLSIQTSLLDRSLPVPRRTANRDGMLLLQLIILDPRMHLDTLPVFGIKKRIHARLVRVRFLRGRRAGFFGQPNAPFFVEAPVAVVPKMESVSASGLDLR
jgi:hypothetical protein